MVFADLEKKGYHKLIPAGAVFTGGGSRTIGVLEIAKHLFRVPVRLGKPADPSGRDTKTFIPGLTDEFTDQAFASLVGLLLAGDMMSNGKGGSSVLENLQVTITNPFRCVSSQKGNYSVFEKIKDIIQQFLP